MACMTVPRLEQMPQATFEELARVFNYSMKFINDSSPPSMFGRTWKYVENCKP
jgi:hypothetical protein